MVNVATPTTAVPNSVAPTCSRASMSVASASGLPHGRLQCEIRHGASKRLTNGDADLDAQGKQILHELDGIRDAMKALNGGAEALAISQKVDKAVASVNATLATINKTQQDQNAALKKIRILALAGL